MQILARQFGQPGLLRVRLRNVAGLLRLHNHASGAIRLAANLTQNAETHFAADKNVVTAIIERHGLLDLSDGSARKNRRRAEIIALPPRPQKDDSKTLIRGHRVGDHPAVSRLEDVERKACPREEDEIRQREQRKKKLALRPGRHPFFLLALGGVPISKR